VTNVCVSVSFIRKIPKSSKNFFKILLQLGHKIGKDTNFWAQKIGKKSKCSLFQLYGIYISLNLIKENFCGTKIPKWNLLWSYLIFMVKSKYDVQSLVVAVECYPKHQGAWVNLTRLQCLSYIFCFNFVSLVNSTCSYEIKG